jgi:hypothetical protein
MAESTLFSAACESPHLAPKTPSASHLNARRNAFRRRDYGQRCSLNRWIQTALSNSKNAVSFSSACTTNRFPSPRCASAIQIVRLLESMADTKPQLHPGLLRLSAMISQLFNPGFELLFSPFPSQRLKISQPRVGIGLVGSIHRVEELLGRNYEVTVSLIKIRD